MPFFCGSPAPVLVSVGSTTLSGDAASISVSSIPATYKTLIAVFAGTKDANAAADARMSFNAGSTYKYQELQMAGAGVTGASRSTTYMIIANSVAASKRFGGWAIIHMKQGTQIAVTSGGGTEASGMYNSGIASGTTTVADVTVTMSSNNMSAGSQLTVYGVLE